MSGAVRRRILVVSPFTHQNGHFVTLPRDICCGLAAAGHEVTLVHARPFASELDWFGYDVRRICLKEGVATAPRLWRELWPRLATRPSNQCLAWVVWQLRPADYDLTLWTDFQAQGNVWALRLATAAGMYRFRTAFFEHHPPDAAENPAAAERARFTSDRLRVGNTPMIVFSSALLGAWRKRLGADAELVQIPHGLWPAFGDEQARARARCALQLSQDDFVLLVFGVQAVRRKHIDTLFDALSGFEPPNPMTVVFAGRTLDGVAHPFANWRNGVISVKLIDGFVPEAKVQQLFEAADAVWANYRDFPGASGVLQQAIGVGRLSIASSDGEIGRLSRAHDLGVKVEDGSVDAIRECIRQLSSKPRAERMAREQQLASIASQYSWPHVMHGLVNTLVDT